MMAAKKKKKRKYYSKTNSSQGLFARRGLAVLFLLLLLGAILFGLYQLVSLGGSFLFSRNPRFKHKQINITSDGRLSTAKLLAYADIPQGVNLFAVDFKAVRKNLSSVPLIESIRIQRKLPDTLMIQVVERDALAQIRWTRRGLPFLLDRHGVVLPATRTGQSLPLIDGLQLDKLRPGEQLEDSGVQYVLDLLSTADSLGLGSKIKFKRFNLHYSDFIRAELNDEVTAQFPRHSAREKLIRLVRVMQMARDQGDRVKTVDLVPDGINVPTTYW